MDKNFVDDVRQDVFIKILHYAKKIKSTGAVGIRSYVRRIAFTESMSKFRFIQKEQEKQVPIITQDEDGSDIVNNIIDPAPYTDDALDCADLQQRISQFVAGLTKQERAVVLMKWDGKRPVDIANKLGISQPRISQIRSSIRVKAKNANLEIEN